MSLAINIVLSVLLLFVTVKTGEALQCYQCEGEPGSDCAKGVESAMELVECPNGSGLSYAMCLQSDIRSGSSRKFERGCTKWSNPTYCTLMYQLSAQFPIGLRVFSCNQCSTPKCNNQV